MRKTRPRLPVLSASNVPGSVGGVGVMRFSSRHARVLLGPHLHADLEMMYIERGRGTDQLGEERFDVGPGDLLIVAPGVVHDASDLRTAEGWGLEFGLENVTEPYLPLRSEQPTASHLWWGNPLLAPFLTVGERPLSARLRVPAADRRRWVGRMAAIRAEQRGLPPGYQQAIASHLLLTLVDVARLAGTPPAAMQQQGEPHLAQVFEVIDEQYAHQLSTAAVADAVGLTAGYLTTLIRQRTGRTVLDWITERRMTEARTLLMTTSLSVEQVAYRVGFGDPAYFSRRFRSRHGLPPARWRQAAGRNPQRSSEP